MTLIFNEFDIAFFRSREKRNAEYKAKARYKRKMLRESHPEELIRPKSKSRGLGFNPLNSYFKGATHHHLHLEGNNEFVIFIPTWLHRMYNHNVSTWNGMDTINAIALDYFINEELYNKLL